MVLRKFFDAGGKRAHSRKMVTEPANIVFNIGDSGSPLKCVTLNVRPSGVSLYSEQPLETGSIIGIHCKRIWKKNPKKGLVKWCRKLNEGLFRVGLMLIDSSESSRADD